MRNIAIDAEYKRVERARKRVGRPRVYWLQETMKRVYRLIRKERSNSTSTLKRNKKGKKRKSCKTLQKNALSLLIDIVKIK